MLSRRTAPQLLAPGLVVVTLWSACASAPGKDSGRLAPAPAEAGDPLPGWSETAEKQAILDFVAKVTRPGSPDYLPPEHRLATFDFDGTIGCEKPDYMEVVVATHRLCEITESEPDRLEEPLYRAACEGDRELIDQQVQDVLLEAFEGKSQSFYVSYVESFLARQEHPRFERPYGRLYYLPMLQLIELLRANEFLVYIVSGSQQGFTRGFGSGLLGFPAAQTIGHTVELDLSWVGGHPSLIRQAAFLPPSIDGKGKVEVIRNRIGLQPVFAFGNSMGDFEMLQVATSGDQPGLGLILVHDDPDEYVYEDEELVRKARAHGWQVVSMKESFETIFPPQSPESMQGVESP